MRPLVIIAPNDGGVSIEDVQKIVEEAYNQGYEDGQNSIIAHLCSKLTKANRPNGNPFLKETE